MKIPLLFALVGTLTGASVAQTESAPKVVDQNAKRTFRMTLKNVKPSLMARWLDPINHETPPEYRTQNNSRNIFPDREQMPSSSRGTSLPGVFSLPQGVDRVVAVDPQNALLVFGTPQGAAELAAAISFLDKPLRLVELEARFVRIDNKELDKITSNLVPAGEDSTQVWRTKSEFKTSLDSLIKSGTATVSFAPRVLAINNLTASLGKTSNDAVQLKSANGIADLPTGAALYLETNDSFDVTPTINSDNRLTLLAHFGQSVQLKNSASFGNTLSLQKDSGDSQTIFSAEDGETVVFKPQQTATTPQGSQTTLVLLTAHIVKRTGEN